MLEADGIVFASPECNYGPSGVLKNAIDWLSRMTAQPFAAKPTAMLGASSGVLGTARAVSAAPDHGVPRRPADQQAGGDDRRRGQSLCRGQDHRRGHRQAARRSRRGAGARRPAGRGGRQASSEALLRPQAEDIGDQVILVARADWSRAPSWKSGMRLWVAVMAPLSIAGVVSLRAASAGKVGRPSDRPVVAARLTTWQLAHQRSASAWPRRTSCASAIAGSMSIVLANASSAKIPATFMIPPWNDYKVRVRRSLPP